MASRARASARAALYAALYAALLAPLVCCASASAAQREHAASGSLRSAPATPPMSPTPTPTRPTLARTSTPTPPTPPTLPVSVSLPVALGEAGTAVPGNFLGLSFEMAALPQLAGDAQHGDLVALLRSLGHGVVRFGGVTADEDIAWVEGAPPPPWASGTIEAGELRELGALSAHSDWHVLLTLGFGHYEPQVAAREAAAAKASLGGYLDAFEIGNEPDSYARHGLREQPWTFLQYDEQVAAYRQGIEALAPGVALAGPDTSGSSAYEKWGLGEAIYQRPALLTGHHYPLGCNQLPPPSIGRLLSPYIRELEEASLRRYLLVAQQSELPFRLDETNTVSCGGVAGVSDTFASAL
ncbi:MAG TPA: hypothetical protein VKV16_04525, partial [Solirubrobacteraceae bacterium]|nr:hypothetical protein [Solirubrobacteraceae bacterium]